jgi:hypothetical protein
MEGREPQKAVIIADCAGFSSVSKAYGSDLHIR